MGACTRAPGPVDPSSVPLIARQVPDCGERECLATVPAEPIRERRVDYTGAWILFGLFVAAIVVDLVLWRRGKNTESEGVRAAPTMVKVLVTAGLAFLIFHFW